MKEFYFGSLASGVTPPIAVAYYGTKGSVDAISSTLSKELGAKTLVDGLIRTNQPRGIKK